MTNFERCKKEFKNLVQNSPKLGQDDKGSGIYCLYIDSPLIIDQIPIYIGQSKNMYGRLLQHQRGLNNILKLNGVEITILHSRPCSYYSCKTFFGALYNRMFDVILANGIRDPKDIALKAKVVEHCDTCNLQEKENYYIRKYGADAYGFNQPIVSEWLHRVRKYPSKYGISQILDWVIEYVSTRNTNNLDAGEQYVFELAVSVAHSTYYIYQNMEPDSEIEERLKILSPFFEEYTAMIEASLDDNDDDENSKNPTISANYYCKQALYWNPSGEQMTSKTEDEVRRALRLWLNDYREILRQCDSNNHKMQSWGAQLRFQIVPNQQSIKIEQVMRFLDSIDNDDILKVQRQTLRTIAERHNEKQCSGIFIDDFGLGWHA